VGVGAVKKYGAVAVQLCNCICEDKKREDFLLWPKPEKSPLFVRVITLNLNQLKVVLLIALTLTILCSNLAEIANVKTGFHPPKPKEVYFRGVRGLTRNSVGWPHV